MILRGVYRLLLRIHPPAFRERFAAEMLWIFDEMSSAERRFALRDGVSSVAIQWMNSEPVPRTSMPFAPVIVSSFDAKRVLQATAVAVLLTLGFFKLLTQSVPLPTPPKDFSRQRRAAWALCRVYRSGEVRHASDPADCRSQR